MTGQELRDEAPASLNPDESGQKFVASIQPSHTSTPHKYQVTADRKTSYPNDKESDEISGSRSSSDASATLPLKMRSASVDGDADVSEGSSTPHESPVMPKRGILKKDEVLMQLRQPTPLPHKKSSVIVERTIDITEDTSRHENNNNQDNEERKRYLLGSTKSIQIVSRKASPLKASPRLPKKADVLKSNVVQAESTGIANGVINTEAPVNSQLSEYMSHLAVEKDDTKVVGDVDFTSSSHVVSEPDDVFIVELTRGDRGLGLGLIDGLVSLLVFLFVAKHRRSICIFITKCMQKITCSHVLSVPDLFSISVTILIAFLFHCFVR